MTARREELLGRCYEYVLDHGLAELSLRPMAAEVGSSPRVLLYLFTSKEGLVREVLGCARAAELEALEAVTGDGLEAVTKILWGWLSDERHRRLLILWCEAYTRSLVEPGGPWSGFAQQTVEDWLDVLARSQPAAERRTQAGLAARTRALALLRGGLLDLLATGDDARLGQAVIGPVGVRVRRR